MLVLCGALFEKLGGWSGVSTLTIRGLVFVLTSKKKERGQKVKPALASIPLHIMESSTHCHDFTS